MKAGRARRALEAFIAAVVHVVPCLAYIACADGAAVYGPIRTRPARNRPRRRDGLVVARLATYRLIISSSICRTRGAYAIVFGDASGRTRYARCGAIVVAHQAQCTVRASRGFGPTAVRSHATNFATRLAISRPKVASRTRFAEWRGLIISESAHLAWDVACPRRVDDEARSSSKAKFRVGRRILERVGAGLTRTLAAGEAVIDVDRACWTPLAPIIVAIVVVHAKPAAHAVVIAAVHKAALTLYAGGGGASAVPIASFIARLALIDAASISAESSIGAGRTVRGRR